ncbi:MAG TPA: tyrosine decarboxylase MfnA [Spirochaetia bacterium]|nr:tyrosine decarboxylase MfnA [Spirochaetia bacterium]
MTDAEIRKALSRLWEEDMTFSSGKILGSMCSKPDPLAAQVFADALEKNIGDTGLFPGTKRLEEEAVSEIASFLSSTEAKGSIVTGGTEANFLALLAAKNHAGKNKREVVLPESAHYSFDKAAAFMDLSLRKIPLTDSFTADVNSLREAVNDRTMAIIAVAGSTGLGAVDPIPEIAKIAQRHSVYLHVDAAFGGFVLPFLKGAGYKGYPFDFSIEGVSSITIDPHKMGRAPVPAGCILFRDEQTARLAETPVSYLAGGRILQRTLVGTRSGASVAAVWAAVKRLGVEGYTEIVKRCMDTTLWFSDRLKRIPGIELVMEPVMNVVGIRSTTFSQGEFASAIRSRGWAVSLFPDFIRIVLMPHLTREVLDSFLTDLTEIVKHAIVNEESSSRENR